MNARIAVSADIAFSVLENFCFGDCKGNIHVWMLLMTRVSDGAEKGDSECSALLGGSELARKIWGNEGQKHERCIVTKTQQNAALYNLPFTVCRCWAFYHESLPLLPVGDVQGTREVQEEETGGDRFGEHRRDPYFQYLGGTG